MPSREERWHGLFCRAIGGDGAAYAAFLGEAGTVVRAIVRARGGPEADEEDIVQEVLLAIHTKRHTWRMSDPVSPWIFAIARYKTADAWRRRGIAATPIADVEEMLADETVQDVTAARDLALLLDGIDARSADIVRSVGLAGQSAAEVGARLGMAEGAVRVAYHRAMTRLKTRVGDAEAPDEDG
jgi:RNA polymerase sigma-70 factor (ECF subfamily)